MDREPKSTCAYVIGNNGEGKSLLLRELAEDSVLRGRKTIGISCSATDRFPLAGRERKNDSNFIYEGTRTSTRAADHHRLASEVSKKFMFNPR